MDSFIHSASTFLDRPGFDWKALIIGFSTVNFVFESYLKWRQIRTVTANGDKVPKELEGKIDSKTAIKSTNYSISKLKFSLVSSFYSLAQNVLAYKYDLLPKLWGVAGNFMAKLVGHHILPVAMSGVITHSLFFSGIITLLSTVLGLPLGYYNTFVLEEKYGFNKSTPKLWISDLVKGLLVGVVVGGPILAGFLKIIDYFGDQFMYYLSIFMGVVQIFLIIIYPKFIQPLFNKLTPLEDGELKSSIEKLASQNKFPLDKLYVIDGSKRSSHSNAYFMGLPWGSKQIVLFDTLIEQCSVRQVVGVLGHEIGHWALSHTTKLLAINQFHMFWIFTFFAAFVKNNSLYQSFGFTSEQPIIVGFMLFSDILGPVDSILEFAMSLLSRTYEYQADEYSTKLGYGDDLKESLISLNKENLGSLVVDWLYSAYTYDHPHLVERLKNIDRLEEELASEKKD
ncbi:DEKNAAC105495 [Brettanomyces naardenensis]|uniref:CAAX prenyl protease n=1 Tax=Brettanomyces naardenensis TaxID=13370 RepID=A0A448YTM0_BRENA|nr:DEKNAAC105495 [Brettanomyces naardenensis]